MAFLRLKRARGRPYAYLVENRWDGGRGQSRQKVLGYLGRLDRVTRERLPAEYRTPAITRALAALQREEQGRSGDSAGAWQERFLEELLGGDRRRAGSVARAALRDLGDRAFFDHVFTPVLHELGRRWASGQVGIGSEHLASGMAAALLTEFNVDLRAKARGGAEVVLCVPDGEQHTLPLLLAERPLLQRGLVPLNIGGAAPTEAIVRFVSARHPHALLISVTQPGSLPKARALALRLNRELPGLRVALGGQAVQRGVPSPPIPGVEVVRSSLEEYLGTWSPSDGAARTPPSSRSRPGGRARAG